MLHGGEVVFREHQPVGHVRRADWSHVHTNSEAAGCRGVCALFAGPAGGEADGALHAGDAGRTRVPLEALERWARAPQVHYEVGLAHNIRVPIRLMP